MTVGGRTSDEIKDEICQLQTWAKIQEVIKIKEYTHVLKLICKDSETTQRILISGLLAFNTKINPNKMTVETFTYLFALNAINMSPMQKHEDFTKKDIKCSEYA